MRDFIRFRFYAVYIPSFEYWAMMVNAALLGLAIAWYVIRRCR